MTTTEPTLAQEIYQEAKKLVPLHLMLLFLVEIWGQKCDIDHYGWW